MGRLKLQAGINAIEEEEPEECDAAYPDKTTLACMINSEIGAVLAVMRRNVRWGGRYMSGDDQLEHSLIQSFKTVRRQIFSWHHHQWQAINPALYLQPFLDVIRSDETGAPITGVALSSVYKILTLDVIDQNTVNVEDAMHLVVDAVTSCRFEVIDPSSEEVVLMKILQVLLACMKSKASIMLSNQHVCTIVNTCFRIVHQAGSKGELLQQIARYTMHELVRCIFSHLQDVGNTDHALVNGSTNLKQETGGLDNDYAFGSRQLENGSMSSEYDNQSLSTYSPARTASQQGSGKVGRWKINFLSTQKWENPLMGWTSTGDPYSHVGDSALTFDSEAAAKAFAEKHGWEYSVKKPHTPLLKVKSYADNFKWKGPPKPAEE